MRKLKRIVTLVGALAALSLPGAAFAAGAHLSLVGGIEDGKPSAENLSTDYSAKLGYGGGALLGFSLGMRTELEFGAIYVVRSWKEKGGTVDTKAPAVEVPVLLRFWLARVLSVGVGGYFSQAVGDLTQTVGGVSASGSYDSYPFGGMSRTDYGLVGSVGLRFPIGPGASIILDGRYVYGLKNLLSNAPAGSGDSLKLRDFQALAGLRFGVGM